MQNPSRDSVRRRLLEDWQRAFPLVPRPFAVIADTLGLDETDVIERLQSLLAEGAIGRVGGVVRPNTLGASTLAAMAVPELQVGAVAALVGAEAGVNHVYLRENDWNLWFVVTGPDRTYVDATLHRLEQRTGLRVLDLRLERPYRLDLGFPLDGRPAPKDDRSGADPMPGCTDFVPEPGDREIVQALTDGLPLVPRPFTSMATALGRSEGAVIARLEALTAAGIVPRIGVIVRHRAIGWRANAMVVWDVPMSEADRAGALLAGAPGINLCYRRRRYAREWPYNLYCMVHAKTREEALATLADAQRLAGLDAYPRQILFSSRCYKQTGAMLARPREAA